MRYKVQEKSKENLKQLWVQGIKLKSAGLATTDFFTVFFFLLLLTFNYFLCQEKRKMLLFWSKVWALMNGHNTLIKLWNNEEETGCNAGLVYWSVSSHQYWPTIGSQVPQTINLFRVFLGAWKLHLLDRFKMDFEQFSEIYIH